MANFKRSKPRKQTRHPISNYGRGHNKTKGEEEPHSGTAKGVAKKKPKKPFGIKVTTIWSNWVMKMFPGWTNPQIRYQWYVTEGSRDTALKVYQTRRGRNDRENITYEPVERYE